MQIFYYKHKSILVLKTLFCDVTNWEQNACAQHLQTTVQRAHDRQKSSHAFSNLVLFSQPILISDFSPFTELRMKLLFIEFYKFLAKFDNFYNIFVQLLDITLAYGNSATRMQGKIPIFFWNYRVYFSTCMIMSPSMIFFGKWE